MIDYIAGTVKQISEKSAVILVNRIGFALHMPQTKSLQEGKEIELFTYLHWNQEKGPALYGFHEKLERTVFLMIINCPKIGPGIALNILSQINASQFLEIITSQNDAALSSVNGIGTKKAEQIIMQLKHKVSKLIASGTVVIDNQQDFTQWQNVNDVLTSLNYSRQEVSSTMKYLSEHFSEQNHSLDQLIRAALAYISKTKDFTLTSKG